MSGAPSGTPPVPPTMPHRVPSMPPRPGAGEPPRQVDPPRRPSELVPQHRAEAETRQLIVGREISLSGEIRSCDRLVVEGSVEANLTDCHDIDIAESGLFKGSASIEEAEIRGRFEGTLTVKKRLFIRSSGKVSGTVRYGQIEVECGGQISGEIHADPIEAEDPHEHRRSALDAGHSALG